MTIKKKLTREELWEIIEAEDTIEIESNPYKHDMSFHHYVTKLDNGNWYAFTVIQSYNDGTQHDDGDTVEFNEVRPVQKVITDWEPV